MHTLWPQYGSRPHRWCSSAAAKPLASAIAVADNGMDREVRYFGTISNRPEALHAALKKVGQDGSELRVCHESGPCGFVIYRSLAKIGVDCMVISPSSMPRRPGDRVKTDRRDAQTLARLLRAGELVAVWIPDGAHEAIRDVVRARRQAKDDLRRQVGFEEFPLAARSTVQRESDLGQGSLGLAVGTEVCLSAPATGWTTF